MTHKSWRDLLVGFLLGGAIGTFLFKTEKGKKFQKGFLHQCHKISDQSHEFINKIHSEKKSTKKKPKARKKA